MGADGAKSPSKSEQRAAAAKVAQNVRNPSRGAEPKRGCLKRLLVLMLGLALGGAGIATAGWLWVDATLPDVFSLEAYRGLAKESTRVYAAGGEVVARFGDEIRTVIGPERIPPTVRYAMVCAEDSAFYSHPGLDVAGIARALWVDLTQGRYAQGASTLTQQFAKTRFLGREKTFTRKLKELVLARKLETHLTKDEILTLYLNEVYFGHGRYGIEEAARFFFGRSASELDLAQAALLTGLVNSPSRLSPLQHPDRAKARRTYVLRQMLGHGYIAQADFDRADAAPLPSVPAESLGVGGDWYLEAVRRQALEKIDKAQLYGGGLRIEIAMDVGLQQAAEQAVRRGLQSIDARYKVATPLKHYDDPASLQAGLAKLTAQQGDHPAAGRVLLGVVQEFDATAKAYDINLGSLTGTLAASDLERYRAVADAAKGESQGAAVSLKAGDLIRVSLRENTPKGWTLSPEFGPQAALVAIDPKTRLVRALVGGDDFDLHPYDRTRALRQPGSTFKTFTYGAAIEAGLVTPDTERVDAAVAYPVGSKSWTPRNFSGSYDGKSHTLRDALAQSINSIAVAVAQQVGPEQVAKFAERMGIHSPLTPGLPLALGASSVTLLELTNAYATIAADGRLAEPILITRIVDRTGKDLVLAPREPGQIVAGENVMRQLTDMLGEVVRRGSGKEAQNAGRPVVGKTGTSNASRDTWFVGFSADLCAGVWVGYDDRKEMPKATGGMLAVPIWTQFFKQGLAAVPVHPLPRLPHIMAGAVANLPGPAVDAEAGAADLDDAELAPDQPLAAPADLPKRRGEVPVDDEAIQ